MDPLQNDIMTALGFDKLPEEEQKGLYERIGGVLFQGILIRALETMSEDEQDAFDAFLGEHPDDPAAMLAYLREHVAEFDALTESEVARFKASALEIVKGDTVA